MCPSDVNATVKWTAYRHISLCNYAETDCSISNELHSLEEYSSFVVILHTGQWDMVKNVAGYFSKCKIQYSLVDISNVESNHVLKCAVRTTTVIYSLTKTGIKLFSVRNVTECICMYSILLKLDVQRGSLKEVCSPINTVQYPILETVSASCSNTLWLTGSLQCNGTLDTFAMKLLRYKNDEEVLRDGTFGKYYVRNKHLRIGVRPVIIIDVEQCNSSNLFCVVPI